MNKNKHFKFNIAHFVLPIAVIAAIFSIAKSASGRRKGVGWNKK